MKTVLFLPGGKEYYNTRNYAKVLSAIRKCGYKAVFVPINWRHAVLSTQVEQLNRIYKKHDPKNTILAGFSWGAMTALMAASTRQPKELWLFSLSDHFKEHIEKSSKSVYRFMGKNRLKEFRSTPLAPLAKKISTKTLIFLGEAEAKRWPAMEDTAKQANRQIRESKLFVVPKTSHDVTHENYIQTIIENI